MKNNKNILISVQDIKEIIEELDKILTLCDDKLVKDKIEKVLYLIKKDTNIDVELSIADTIFEKMQELKHVDEDEYFKLYMLYRKLEDGKISESDAKRAFKMYERQ